MGELAESQYVYFACDLGFFRVKIPKFNTHRKPKFKIEPVFYNESCSLPHRLGMFSHDHKIYTVGGHEKFEFSKRMYMFDPSRFKEFPVSDDLNCLEKPELRNRFEGMIEPCVIQAKDKIYFFSYLEYLEGELKGYSFQSFDPTKNCFETHPCPPLSSSDVSLCDDQISCFFLRGYVYLFFSMEDKYSDGFHASTFNTISSEWKERKSLLRRFSKRKIVFPRSHRGDVGISDEFSDQTRILVALSSGKPTAYRVKFCGGDWGDFRPKSHRVLKECYIPEYKLSSVWWSHLVDIGDGRFCVIHNTFGEDVMMFIFKIDFALEHDIQTSASPRVETSSEILCSKKFEFLDSMSFQNMDVCNCCFVSAPSNEDDQEKGIIVCGTTRNEGEEGNKAKNKKRKSRHSS